MRRPARVRAEGRRTGQLHTQNQRALGRHRTPVICTPLGRAHTKLLEAGTEADLIVFEGMSHADYLVEFSSPEHQLLIDRKICQGFFRSRMAMSNPCETTLVALA